MNGQPISTNEKKTESIRDNHFMQSDNSKTPGPKGILRTPPLRKSFLPSNSVNFNEYSERISYTNLSNSSGHSSSGKSTGKTSLRALLPTTTGNEHKLLHTKIMIHKTILRHAILLTKKYYNIHDENYTYTKVFFYAVILALAPNIHGISEVRAMTEIENALKNLDFYSFDFSTLFNEMHTEVIKNFPKKSFAFELFLASLMSEIGKVMSKTIATRPLLINFTLEDLNQLKELLPKPSNDPDLSTRIGHSLPDKLIETISSCKNTEQHYLSRRYSTKDEANLREFLIGCSYSYLADKLFSNTEKISPSKHQLQSNFALKACIFKMKFKSIEQSIQYQHGDQSFAQLFFKKFFITYIPNINIYNRGYQLTTEADISKIFSTQLQFILDELPSSISLWRLGHLLLTHSDELFIASFAQEITHLFMTHNGRLNNQDAIAISQEFLAQMGNTLSPIYLKQINGQMRFKEREDLEHELQVFRYTEYAEWASYFTSAVMALLITLMATKIIKPQPENYIAFSLVMVFAPLLGVLHRRFYRIAPQKEIENTLAIYSQKNGPQLFPTRTERGPSNEEYSLLHNDDHSEYKV